MRIKKFMSVILVVALMFSFCSFFVSAESVSTFSSNGLVYQAAGVYDLVDIRDITSQISTYADTYQNNGCYCYKIPLSTIPIKMLNLKLNYGLSNTHNYNLKLSLNCDVPSDTTGLIVIDYYDIDNNVIGEQTLYSVPFTALKWTDIDINFTPDSSLLSQSVSHSIVFSFVYDGTIANNIRFSQYIEITDEDDNASWFEKIISAIKQIPTNFINGIRSFFENLGNKISELGDNIQSFFVELGENIGDFFTMLKNYLLYFQHPVTTNSDGVLVDGSGKPVYTNPFYSAMNSVKNTVNSWLSDIDDFISDIDRSRQNVESYLDTGSSVINDVLGSSPLLSAAVIFAAAFLVIRKVVGR